MQNAKSKLLRRLITTGSVSCIPGACDKNICFHPHMCLWMKAVTEIYEIERGLEDELD